MAEAVGVVASGIGIATLAVQIANSVAKLKSYWEEVKEAPEDMKLLIENIEVLSDIFSDIEEDQRQNPISSTILDGSSLSRCLEFCKRGADRLKELTDDLSANINASSRVKCKWASSKIVSKKSKIEKYKNRLAEAERLLSLSHQCYLRVLIKLQPAMIVSRLSSASYAVQSNPTLAAIAFSAPATESSDVNPQSSASSSQALALQPIFSAANSAKRAFRQRNWQQEKLVARYRILAWFWAWHIEILRSQLGWTCKLRAYNIISSESLAWSLAYDLIVKDDLDGLQTLFSSRQSSIFDVTEEGMSLLNLAAHEHRFPICKFLLEQGAEPSREEITHMLAMTGAYSDLGWQEAVFEFIRLLTDVYNIGFEIFMLEYYVGPVELFRSLQRLLDSPYHEAPLEIRAQVAMEMISNAPPSRSSPDNFRAALQQEMISQDAALYISSQSQTLLHAVARAIGSKVYWYWHEGVKSDILGWRAVLRELVTSGADLYAITDNTIYSPDLPECILKRTPFLNLLRGCSACPWDRCGHINVNINISQQAAKIWLEDLETCGINLLEYGLREQELQTQILSQPHRSSVERSWDPEGLWRRFRFTYGASPSDWRFWYSEPLNEEEEEVMPGTWIE